MPAEARRLCEDVLLQDGKVVRKQRTTNLGRKKDIPTKRLAERELAKIIAEINDKEYRPRAILTVKQFVENHYRKLVLPLKKATTRHGYGVALNKHILPRFGERQVSEVTKENIQAFILEKQNDGLSWNTLANLRAVLGAVFTSAVEAGLRKSHPVRGVRLPPEPERELAELPSDRDLDRLERELPEPYSMLIRLLRMTGMRIAEALALKRSDVDAKMNRLQILRTIHDGKVHSPKSKRSRRPIALSDKDMKRLVRFMNRSPEARRSDWVFPNKNGDLPLRADNILERVIRPAVRKLGMKRVTFHLLRHWAITALLEEGVQPKVVQKMVGHSRIDTTLKYYQHITDGQMHEAADALSRRVNGKHEVRNWPESVNCFANKSEAASA